MQACPNCIILVILDQDEVAMTSKFGHVLKIRIFAFFFELSSTTLHWQKLSRRNFGKSDFTHKRKKGYKEIKSATQNYGEEKACPKHSLLNFC